VIDSKQILSACVIALITFLATKYIEAIDKEDDKQNSEIDSLKSRLNSYDSLWTVRKEVLKEYDKYYSATIDGVRVNLDIYDSLNIETINTIENVQNEISLDSIINDLKHQTK
jgi:hypothetical protein